MKAFVKKYEIWIFLVLAPLINTGVTYANSKGIISGFVYTHGRFYALLALLVCLVKFTRGNAGLVEVFRPMRNWKIHPKWYIFGLCFALSVGLLTLGLKSLYTNTEYSSLLEWHLPTLKSSFFLLTWAFMGEVVWVSYSIRTLSKIMKPFYASQIIGFTWALWWVPTISISAGVIEELPLWPLFLNMMGAAGMCTIVYGHTKSGICVWILQYMLNMSLILLPLSPKVGGASTYSAFATLYFIVMLVLMYVMNPNKKMRQPV